MTILIITLKVSLIPAIGQTNCKALPASSDEVISLTPAQASQLPGIIQNAKEGTTIELKSGTYVVHSGIRILNKNITLRSASGGKRLGNY